MKQLLCIIVMLALAACATNSPKHSTDYSYKHNLGFNWNNNIP